MSSNTNINSNIKLVAGIVLALFLSLHAVAFYEVGLQGLFRVTHEVNAWSYVFATDLVISLACVATWMVRDAKKRGVSAIPYLVLTVALGSVGPLLYLLRRDSAPST